jgi:hypothetical protein
MRGPGSNSSLCGRCPHRQAHDNTRAAVGGPIATVYCLHLQPFGSGRNGCDQSGKLGVEPGIRPAVGVVETVVTRGKKKQPKMATISNKEKDCWGRPKCLQLLNLIGSPRGTLIRKICREFSGFPHEVARDTQVLNGEWQPTEVSQLE